MALALPDFGLVGALPASTPLRIPALLPAPIAEAGDTPSGQVLADASHARDPGTGSRTRVTSHDVSLGG